MLIRFLKNNSYLLTAMLLVSMNSNLLHAAPLLYFYPKEYKYADGYVLNSPQTINIEQITSDFKPHSEMTGVVLMVYWSTLCPKENECDFSLIDETLTYWAKRNKKVVLSVVTIGYPIASMGNEIDLFGATPSWVMSKIKTYKMNDVLILGTKPYNQRMQRTLPDFRDDNFLQLQIPLLKLIAKKYDGNPTISEIRIGLGVMGEENPLVGAISNPVKGYKEAEWIEYCQRITEVYVSLFKNTTLEVGISRMPWISAKGSNKEKESVELYIKYLLNKNIMLTYNGLESNSELMLQQGNNSSSGLAHSLRHLIKYKKLGGKIGLEVHGGLTNPRMGTKDINNAKKIANAVKIISPNRLVLFYDVIRISQKKELNDIYKARELLKQIGYSEI